MRRVTPREAAAAFLRVEVDRVRLVRPEEGVCSARLNDALCMLPVAHEGPHRATIHMDDQGRKWMVLAS